MAIGFNYGQMSIPALIASWAADLASTGDFSIVDSGVSGGYALRHKEENLYLTLAVTPGPWTAIPAVGGGSGYKYQHGISVIYSTGFDTVGHVPSGTIKKGIITLSTPTGSAHGINTYLTDAYNGYQCNYWIDKYGIIGVIQNPYSHATMTGSFFALEWIPVAKREYSDGYTDAFFWSRRNYEANGSSYAPYAADNEAADAFYRNIRAFKTASNGAMVEEPYLKSAFRSNGNSKIYFEFAKYHNDLEMHQSPIAQTRRFFIVGDGAGLSLNDIVSWLDPNNVTVHKFFITAATSPTTAAKFFVGIPYENAYLY